MRIRLARCCADATGACFRALGFSPGFGADLRVSPYLKLLPMLMGIGSPGTMQEARSLHLGCCFSQRSICQRRFPLRSS